MISNLKFFLFPQIFQTLFTVFIIIPITTFYLTPKDFGIYAVIFLIISFVIPFISSAPRWILGSNYFKNNVQENKILFFNIIIFEFILKSTVILIFFFLGKTILSLVIVQYESTYLYLFQLALIATWLGSSWPVISQLLILQKRAKLHSFIEIFKFIFGGIITILAISYFNSGVEGLLYGLLATNLFSFLFEVFITMRFTLFSLSSKWMREIVFSTIRALPTILSDTLKNFSDRYFIQLWLNLSQLGIYAHSQSYYNVFKLFFKSFYNTISPDTLNSLTNNKSFDLKKLKNLIGIAMNLLFLLGIPVILFSEDIISFLTHDKFTSAAQLVPLWYVIIFSFLYGVMALDYLIIKKKFTYITLSLIFISVVSLPITGVLIYFYGLTGAVISLIISNFSLQIWRNKKATSLGLYENNGISFWFFVLMYLIVYFLSLIINLNLMIKLILLTLVIILLFLLFKKNYKLLELDRFFNI